MLTILVYLRQCNNVTCMHIFWYINWWNDDYYSESSCSLLCFSFFWYFCSATQLLFSLFIVNNTSSFSKKVGEQEQSRYAFAHASRVDFYVFLCHQAGHDILLYATSVALFFNFSKQLQSADLLNNLRRRACIGGFVVILV
jgi:hypothetical protein